MVLSASEVLYLALGGRINQIEDVEPMELDDGRDEVVKRLAPNSRRIPKMKADTFLSIDPRPETIEEDGFDLVVGDRIYVSDTVALRLDSEGLERIGERHELHEGEDFVLDCDMDGQKVYYIVSRERIKNSENLEFIVDSKSTSARLGAMSHCVGRTQDGEFITLVQPYQFPLVVTAGKDKLSQVVVRFEGSSYLSSEEILQERRTDGKKGIDLVLGEESILDQSLSSRGISMGYSTHVALRAKGNNDPINLGADKGSINWEQYWEIIDGNHSLTLDAKKLHLMGAQGVIHLGAQYGILSREHDIMTGTGVINNLAAIFHFGYVGEITLEVIANAKTVIHNGDIAGEVWFDNIKGSFDQKLIEHDGQYQGHRAPMLPGMFTNPF
jgi:deoxycytidine triphosphate deaminase